MLSSEKWFVFVVFLGQLLWISNASALRCKEGRDFAYWLSASDAIALITIDEASLASALDFNLARREFSAERFIKPPLVGGLAQGVRGILEVRGVSARRRLQGGLHFAFLKYERGRRWSSTYCAVLPVLAPSSVKDACTVISDLYAENPYIRERKCLLAYPPDVSVDSLEKEFAKRVGAERRVRGTVIVSEAGLWEEQQKYQSFWARIPVREVRKFYPSVKRPSSSSARFYVPSSLLSNQENFEKLFRESKRIKVEAVWTMGSFVVQSFE